MKTPSAASRLRIIVLGYLVRFPMGGMVTSNLQYLIALKRLGHDVYFVEDSDDCESCYDPAADVVGTDPTYGLLFARETFQRIGMGEQWAYYDAHTARWLGPCSESIVSICSDADLVLNLCGVNPLRPWLEDVPARIFVDEDPAFTQVKNLKSEWDRSRVERHTCHFSFAENIGDPDCTIPRDGFAWRPTRQPIVLDTWPLTPPPASGCFTTVMYWSSYPAEQYDGRRFGTKCDAFAPFLDLPRKTNARLEMAAGGVPAAVRRELTENKWELVDPIPLSFRPWTYQRYIQESKAEFSVAKHGYATTRSGWFSERSACYLASGRPVVVQDTGFTKWLPSGRGVVAFDTPEQALAGIEDVTAHYDLHCRAAREIAREYFDAERILTDLLEASR